MSGKTILTFYGEINEVGDNKVLIENKDTRIFLDFSMPLALREKEKEHAL